MNLSCRSWLEEKGQVGHTGVTTQLNFALEGGKGPEGEGEFHHTCFLVAKIITYAHLCHKNHNIRASMMKLKYNLSTFPVKPGSILLCFFLR